MEMDEELEDFLRERKARVAEDRARLQQQEDPPYMEIKTRPYKAYGLTAKENIPPNSTAQGKEDSCMVGLPLGVEYERKKQRLQQELRMDYRRYVAQNNHLDPVDSGPLIHLDNRIPVKKSSLDLQTAAPLSSRLKDAATLTEDGRAPHSTLHQADVDLLHSEEDQDLPSGHPRHQKRPGRLVNQESGEEEPSENGRPRHGGVEGSYEKRRLMRNDGRDRREVPAGAARDMRKLKSLGRSEEAEFATGLIIGAADTNETLQRRKERYRKELQDQIAEQHQNKKREKDLELRVAATGVNDPEKKPDRIRQFGLSRRRDFQVPECSPTAESGWSSSQALPTAERTGGRDREMAPPEQPHLAFQSPLLDYSAALGLGGGGRSSPTGQPPLPSFPTSLDLPRNPLFPPHPPSSLGEAYRTPYAEPHHYYGTRNLLDPNMAYYGHFSAPAPVPAPVLPMSYWNLPPGGAVPCQFGNHSPHSQRSGSSFPEPLTQPSNEVVVEPHSRGFFPSDRSRTTRERVFSYREALKQQIQEQQERRRRETEEKERYEAQLEADMRSYQPWGRGGGGAPLRDSTGNLITDLKQMHKLNEEAYSNPEQRQRRTAASMTTTQRAELADPNDRVSGFTHVQTPQFARGKVFANQPTEQQLQEQDKYKAYLKQQIEEKMHQKAEERERIRLEEEKGERRFAEQRAKIQKEYEEELERKKRKEEEQKAKNEELIQLAEQRKKEAERKKKEAEEKEERESEALRRQYERDRQARLEEVCREPSPPIPTLQNKHRLHQYTPRPPTADSQPSTALLSERCLSGLQSPPVPACRNQLRAAGEHAEVFSELSALRRQLRSEQKRLENLLQPDEWEELDSPLSHRHRERPAVDVFDMARLRLQAPVRRPNSRIMEPRNLLRIHDSLQLQYQDAESGLGFSNPKLEGVASRRRRDYRDPYQQLSSQRSTVQDDYSDLSPPRQTDYLRSVINRSPRGSLLESESAFIDPLGDASPVPRTPDVEKTRQLSARERRRLAKQSQPPQDRSVSSQPVGQHRDTSARRRLQDGVEQGGGWRRGGNTMRSAVVAQDHHGNAAGRLDASDDDSSPHFSPRSRTRGSSEETSTADVWTRPGTADSLKCQERPFRRHRLVT